MANENCHFHQFRKILVSEGKFDMFSNASFQLLGIFCEIFSIAAGLESGRRVRVRVRVRKNPDSVRVRVVRNQINQNQK